MRPKIIVLMLLVTGLALASRPAHADPPICPTLYCIDANVACADGGGEPQLPMPSDETCYTLPNHDIYSLATASCFHPNDLSTTYQLCYW